jgi:hypothetical protein
MYGESAPSRCEYGEDAAQSGGRFADTAQHARTEKARVGAYVVRTWYVQWRLLVRSSLGLIECMHGGAVMRDAQS